MAIVVYSPALAMSASRRKYQISNISFRSSLDFFFSYWIECRSGMRDNYACLCLLHHSGKQSPNHCNATVCIRLSVKIFKGGIKAVVWTDTFQALVLMGSFLAVIIVGNAEAGHWDTVFDLNYQTDRIEFFV